MKTDFSNIGFTNKYFTIHNTYIKAICTKHFHKLKPEQGRGGVIFKSEIIAGEMVS